MQKPVSSQHPDFARGLHTGLYDGKADDYEGYLSSQIQWEFLQKQITPKREVLAILDESLATDPTRRTALFQKATQARGRLSFLQEEANSLRAALATAKQMLTDFSKRNHGAFWVGLLYLVAGIAFVLGDLIISHEIVAYALNIRNAAEAWAFACGLAMVSVLLKPAYERLIENPYQTDNQRFGVRYTIFKLVIVGFSVVTLFVLGWFRYEAFRTDKLKQALTQQLTTDTTFTAEAATRQLATLNQALVDSPWAMASFVLSGLLFALAGAVCLGLAFPMIQDAWQFRKNKPQRILLEEKIQNIENQILTNKNESIEADNIAEIAQYELGLIPLLSEIEARREALLAEITALEDEAKVCEINARTFQYTDGIQQGEALKNILTEAEAEAARRAYISAHLQIPEKSLPNTPHETYPPYTPIEITSHLHHHA